MFGIKSIVVQIVSRLGIAIEIFVLKLGLSFSLFMPARLLADQVGNPAAEFVRGGLGRENAWCVQASYNAPRRNRPEACEQVPASQGAHDEGEVCDRCCRQPITVDETFLPYLDKLYSAAVT